MTPALAVVIRPGDASSRLDERGAKGPYNQCTRRMTAERLGEGFGRAVFPVKDVNGDGLADLVVPAGCVAYLYTGSPGDVSNQGPSAILQGASGGICYDISAAGADTNLDGLSELVVGRTYSLMPGTLLSKGDIQLYLGGSPWNEEADINLVYSTASDHVVPSVASIGDVNDDGIEDVAIGQGPRDTVSTSIHLGKTSSPTAGIDRAPSATLSSGNRLVGAGDVNGDGYDDLLVGEPRYNTNGPLAGRVYLYFGGPGASFEMNADAVFDPGIPDSFFGESMVDLMRRRGARPAARQSVAHAPRELPPGRTRR